MLKQIRGRPRFAVKAQVIERLLDTTELLLYDYSYHDLSEQKIADEVGVNRALIHYYFVDKAGLLCSVIDRYRKDIFNKLDALDNIDPKSQSLTRDIIKTIVDAYYEKPWLTKIIVSELMRNDSVIMVSFLQRYGMRKVSLELIQNLFQKLVKFGVYDRNVNMSNAALNLLSVIIAPLMLAPLLHSIDLGSNEIKKDSWIDQVADLFDRQLRAADSPLLRSDENVRTSQRVKKGA